jgi:hypothetical protein
VKATADWSSVHFRIAGGGRANRRALAKTPRGGRCDPDAGGVSRSIAMAGSSAHFLTLLLRRSPLERSRPSRLCESEDVEGLDSEAAFGVQT